MVFVKVRETYDLHTTENKMTVIGIHTPKPDIIKKNYPGLLMQCKMYRPVSCDVRLACASLLPVDPLGVGTEPGDIAPEDMFNPILYKAMSNKGMSQLEARINALSSPGVVSLDVDGSSASVEVDNFSGEADEFGIYYGLLSNTHDWKHANPQAGLSMSNLHPLVYEMVYNVGDMKESVADSSTSYYTYPSANHGLLGNQTINKILGKAKEMPFIPCTSYSLTTDAKGTTGFKEPGFGTAPLYNCATDVPYVPVVCGCIIVPPSRLHSLYFRLVCEWTIEFSSIRPIGEITDWSGLASIGSATHYQNYSYETTKEAITGTTDTILDKDVCMVSSNVDIEKVM